MPIRISAFGRVFAPSWPMTLATVLLLAVFASLGRWQWQRGEAKEAVWEQFKSEQPAVLDAPIDFGAAPRFTWVKFSGAYDRDHQFLLDNRSHDGSPGYEVLTRFVLPSGRHLLVDRGWIPFSGYRDRLPDISIDPAKAETIVTGYLDELPAAGLASGRAAPPDDGSWPKLTSFPTYAELEAALHQKIEHRVLLLGPHSEASGYVREWTPPGLPPDRHFSYAIQWWGFAVVLLVLYFGLNFRKVP